MYILGINTGLNASAVLMKDNEILFGVQEERLSRIKNQPGWPELSIQEALRYCGLTAKDVDKVAIAGKSSKIAHNRQDDLNKFHERYGKIKKAWFGKSENPFAELASRGWRRLSSSLRGDECSKELTLEDHLVKSGFSERHVRYDHQTCHAAAAYYGLARHDNDPYLVFSLDGGGDGRTSAVFIGQNGKLKEIASSDSFSPACLYAHITYILGFIPHEHEYKLMGLAPYAHVKYAEVAKKALSRFIDFDPGNPLIFTNTSTYPKVRNSRGQEKQRLVEDLFKTTLGMRFDTLSAGLQLLSEEVSLKWIKAGIEKTGVRKVLLSGGFFMNVKANSLIAELPEVEFLNAFPSCGDESNAFGAAFLCHHDLQAQGGKGGKIHFADFCLGPDASSDLEEAKRKYADKVRFEKFDDINAEVVKLLLDRKIVARCSGRMEFGARALGNRSILASPNDVRIINTINAAIKKRDFWMPFAPAALEDKLDLIVSVPQSLRQSYSPYMMFTFRTKPEKADSIIAGVHQADKTARAQTINKEIYPAFHDLVQRFYEKSGITAVLNTSFNLHGYPIVRGACDAIDVYLNSDLDYLVVDDHLIAKLL